MVFAVNDTRIAPSSSSRALNNDRMRCETSPCDVSRFDTDAATKKPEQKTVLKKKGGDACIHDP
jgi:hypothetical protein